MLKELFTNCLEGPWKTAGIDTQYKIQYRTLYFQGSNSLIDWKSNFDFPAIPYKNQPIKWYAHRGFVWAWKLARQEILMDIEQYKVNTIVGYSHGAALATLAHEDLWFNDKSVITYTFGGPRVVWMPNRKILNRWNGLTRIKVNGDIVTNLPPWLLGYKHIGIEMKTGDKHFIPRIKYHELNNYMKNLDGM
jgi:hypothetical protein